MSLNKQLCDYCLESFTPTRNGVQRFCSSKCRKKDYYHKNKGLKGASNNKKKNSKSFKFGDIELKGITEAAIGALAALIVYDLGKLLLTPEVKKNATKEDISRIEAFLNERYFVISNEEPNEYGQKAFFDKKTNQKVYLGSKISDYARSVI